MADSKSDSIMGGHFATNPLENPLWKYACQVYSKLGVEAALLVLQDDHGADINVILQALWLASEGQEWSKACIPNDYTKWVQEQILPLRQMRRSMKTEWVEKRGSQYEDFRQQVKVLELQAEQYALAMLFAHSDNKKAALKNRAAVNFRVLGQEMNIQPKHFDRLIKLV